MEPYLPPLSRQGWRWVRFAGVVVGVAVFLWLCLSLRAVLTPLVAGVALAYILDPAVTFLEVRFRISRLVSVLCGVTLLLGVGAALLIAGATQLVQLASRIPSYIESADKFVRQTLPDALDEETRTALLAQVRSHGGAVAGFLLGIVGGWASNLVWAASFVVLLPMYTFFCLLHFNRIVPAIRDHLPALYRPTIVRICTTIDRAVADFFRGRLIVCTLVGVLSGIGWTLVGVRSGLALGALAGALNLIPMMSVLALPPALVLAWLGANEAGQPWFWPVALTIGVYMAVQAIESFLLSPIVESRASGLHPLATVLALLIGAEFAGMLGMLLAIPVASTLRSLFGEFALPEIRRLAGMSVAPREEPPTAS